MMKPDQLIGHWKLISILRFNSGNFFATHWSEDTLMILMGWVYTEIGEVSSL